MVFAGVSLTGDLNNSTILYLNQTVVLNLNARLARVASTKLDQHVPATLLP